MWSMEFGMCCIEMDAKKEKISRWSHGKVVHSMFIVHGEKYECIFKDSAPLSPLPAMSLIQITQLCVCPFAKWKAKCKENTPWLIFDWVKTPKPIANKVTRQWEEITVWLIFVWSETKRGRPLESVESGWGRCGLLGWQQANSTWH